MTITELEQHVHFLAGEADRWLRQAEANLKARDAIDATWSPEYRNLVGEYDQIINPAMREACARHLSASRQLCAAYDAAVATNA